MKEAVDIGEEDVVVEHHVVGVQAGDLLEHLVSAEERVEQVDVGGSRHQRS